MSVITMLRAPACRQIATAMQPIGPAPVIRTSSPIRSKESAVWVAFPSGSKQESTSSGIFGIGMPDIGHRDREKFRERALAIDSYSLGVGAKMTPPGEAIAAMSADNVTFAGDQITWSETFDAPADPLDHTDKLMADDHRHRDGLLRPGVPVINVNISSADRSLLDPDEHVIVADFRHRNFFQPKTGFGFAFHQRLHRLLHGTKLGESGTQESRKMKSRHSRIPSASQLTTVCFVDGVR